MDALRNTFLEWLHTTSPDDSCGVHLDTWSPPEASDDSGVHSKRHPSGENRLVSTWSSRRYRESGYHNHHQLQHSTNLGRSAAFTGSYHSIHDAANNEDYDEKRHLRVALRSFVEAAAVGGRASGDLQDRSLSSQRVPLYRTFSPGMREDEEDSEFDSEEGSDVQLGTRGASSRNAAAAAAVSGDAVAGGSPQSAAAHGRRSDDNFSDASMTPLQLSMAFIEARTAAAGTNNSRSIQPTPFVTPVNPETADTPPPTCDASFKFLRRHSSTSADYCVEEDGNDDSNNSSLHVPAGVQTLLRPSLLPVSTSSSPPPHDGGSAADAAHRPPRHLVPLREVLADNLSEDDINVPDASAFASTTAAAAGEDKESDERYEQSAGDDERGADASPRRLSVSMAIALVTANLRTNSRSSSGSGGSNVNADDMSALASAAAATAEEAAEHHEPPTVSTTTITAAAAAAATAALSHLNTPVTAYKKGSMMQYHASLMPDDHVAAHVLPSVAAAAAAVEHGKAPTVTPTTTTLAVAAITPAPASSTRHPLLIPQSHRIAHDITGRSALLRADLHFNAAPSMARLPAYSSAHTPLHPATTLEGLPYVASSLTGAGLSSVPQPFGAYPYQWMMAAEQMGSGVNGIGGGNPSTEGSYSAASGRVSPAAFSHLSSSYGMASTATPATMASLHRSASDGQLYATSAMGRRQVWC
ncbi:hypothetical protein ABB37_08593 [Leptomonas pyrrhocoris]|uniref:Uncharacterized protein n=1 Tax=Leptomonas pyrrhocoris TaxID=157538 RepID=A0A0N0DRX2_LEPPY|nr:hypothetical protein ABB37_08593 [Leptomonas pyrrhocoris]KPA75292.1 hypothetical protein ABB37_08593 [Leptomonas pyrrhocoris]|eukprot:XP_015653731.1 hypothetical protein ABB37_08593 [Leptomonas pyrrhocoris]